MQRNFHRLVDKGVVGAGAFFKRGAVDKGLEGGAGLAPCLLYMVKRVLCKVAAADPGADLAVARVQRQKARLYPGFLLAQGAHEGGVCHQLFQGLFGRQPAGHGAPVLRRFTHKGPHQFAAITPDRARAPGSVGHALQLAALARHDLVGHLLQARVEGGVHHQAVGVDVVVVAVSPVDQPFAQLLGKVRGRAHRFKLALKFNAQRPLFQRLKLASIELVALDHLCQHGVATLLGALGVEHRVVVTGALEHADQRGALQQVELRGRFIKVGARRHLNADRVVQKRHGVEVGLEDFRLGVERLDLERGDGFFQLAVERGRTANFFWIQVACQLLRQG